MALVKSPSLSLNSYDLSRWLHNALVFLAPVVLVALGAVINQIPQDWAWGAAVLYVINVLVDLLRKWINENTYQK